MTAAAAIASAAAAVATANSTKDDLYNNLNWAQFFFADNNNICNCEASSSVKGGGGGGGGGGGDAAAKLTATSSSTTTTTDDEDEDDDDNLPTYTMSQVSNYNQQPSPSNPNKRIWMTYGGYVYDVTEFVANHPGGSEKILMGAGGAIEPYWYCESI